MKLKKLVPSLELCRQIPAGEFDDSALVWVKSDPAGCVHSTGEWHVSVRDGVELPGYNKWIPAPTLEEILITFKMDGSEIRLCDQKIAKMGWCCGLYTELEDYGIWWDILIAESALRLWFKVKGIEVER